MILYSGVVFDIPKACKTCGGGNIIYKTYSKQYKYYCDCLTREDKTIWPYYERVDQKTYNAESE